MKYRILSAVKVLFLCALAVQLSYVVLDLTDQQSLILSLTQQLKSTFSYVFC